MDASPRQAWFRAALVVGVVNGLIGRLFALPANDVHAWLPDISLPPPSAGAIVGRRSSLTAILVGMLPFIFAMSIGLDAVSLSSEGSSATWAKGATPLPSCANPTGSEPGHLTSPDGAVVIDVECDLSETLRLRITALGRTYVVPLRDGSQELLWAPDSRAFLINGSESAYAGLFVEVFRIEPNGVKRQAIDRYVQVDMVSQFPPCKAADAPDMCKTIETQPEFNVSGVAWTRGSSAIVVVAEVPCSSFYGGIMCQVRGYEIRSENGRILRELSPPQLKSEWQARMAWQLRIPDPPKYRQQ